MIGEQWQTGMRGQVSNRRRGKRDAKLRKAISIQTGHYERLSEKAEEIVCPRSCIVEYLIDHYLDEANVWE